MIRVLVLKLELAWTREKIKYWRWITYDGERLRLKNFTVIRLPGASSQF